ncbi:MAG: adenylate/guanylate cyclase domain-containing protein, partial [Deltaproteobacteria bacterium]
MPESRNATATPSEQNSNGYEDRRGSRGRRSGEDRRKKQEPIEGPDRRSGKDRRKGERRARKHRRIPIFAKLAIVSTLLTSLFICSISFIILWEQKKQFVSQLTDFGESLVRIAGSNAADKILGEEELVLFQLTKNLAQNEQVLFAVITDHKKIIRAHNRMENLGLPYQPPEKVQVLQAAGPVKKSTIRLGDEEALYFETQVHYQSLKVGEVHLAVSQAKILRSLSDAKFFVLILTLVVICLGVVLSLVLSMYFTVPIRQLSATAKALGMGQFSHRVKTRRNDEFGDLAFAFNRMAEDLEVKEKIEESFGRYVTPEIVNIILANPESRWMKGAMVEASVLFVDIRGFTALSENKTPEVIVDLLNDYLTRVTDRVIKHGGHVNKFVGDEAMAVFGAPVPNPDHAQAAVRAALEIQDEIAELNLQKKMDGMKIGVGVGINSGEMLSGNLGSQKRMEYTVIGDNVNIASRLTKVAKAGEVLISKKTFDALGGKETELKFEERGKAPVKGRRPHVPVYSVTRSRGEEYGNLQA